MRPVTIIVPQNTFKCSTISNALNMKCMISIQIIWRERIYIYILKLCIRKLMANFPTNTNFFLKYNLKSFAQSLSQLFCLRSCQHLPSKFHMVFVGGLVLNGANNAGSTSLFLEKKANPRSSHIYELSPPPPSSPSLSLSLKSLSLSPLHRERLLRLVNFTINALPTAN